MDSKICLCVLLGSFHLLDMPMKASSHMETGCTGTTTTNTASSSEPASTSATTLTTFRTTLGRKATRTTTTNTAYSGEPASANTSTSTFTTASPFMTTHTQLPATQSTDHTATVKSEPGASLPFAAIAGGVGAGLLMLLVVVAVATLCYQRVSSVPENITGHELQGREELSSEEANGQPVSITSPVDNDIVSAFTDLSTHSPTNHRASSGSYTYSKDHLGSETLNRSLRDNYNTVTFQSAVHPSQRCDPHIRTGEKHDHHSYDYLRRTRPGFTSDVDGDTLPPLYNESHVCQIESSDIYNHLRRTSQPPQWSVDYDTMASAAKFVDDMQSVYSYDRLKTSTGPSGV